MVEHVGIILDGNRRLAKRLMQEPWKGHEWGAAKVEKLFDWCSELGIKELTLYAFSMQNFNRPKVEFDHLMRIFNNEFKKLQTDTRLVKESIKINFIGRINLFSTEIQENMHKLMDLTKNHSKHIVNFAMAYGGREEITDAAKKLALEIKSGKVAPEQVNEDLLSTYLYMNNSPDLIIRTGGDRRTSNFLPWQSIYSEWFFLDKMWPEFEKEDLIKVIQEFNGRERRFGK